MLGEEEEGKGGRRTNEMWFIQIWTSRIMPSSSVVVLASILASQIAFIYIEYKDEGREEEGGRGKRNLVCRIEEYGR